MSASAWWDVHCSTCFAWDGDHGSLSKKESEARAKKAGWLVTREENLCPACRDTP